MKHYVYKWRRGDNYTGDIIHFHSSPYCAIDTVPKSFSCPIFIFQWWQGTIFFLAVFDMLLKPCGNYYHCAVPSLNEERHWLGTGSPVRASWQIRGRRVCGKQRRAFIGALICACALKVPCRRGSSGVRWSAEYCNRYYSHYYSHFPSHSLIRFCADVVPSQHYTIKYLRYCHTAILYLITLIIHYHPLYFL